MLICHFQSTLISSSNIFLVWWHFDIETLHYSSSSECFWDFYSVQYVLLNDQCNSHNKQTNNKQTNNAVKVPRKCDNIFLAKKHFTNVYVWVHSQSNMPMFCLEKTYFSALVGGPKVAIFGRDDLYPLYFDVSNLLVPPGYMPSSSKTIACWWCCNSIYIYIWRTAPTSPINTCKHHF